MNETTEGAAAPAEEPAAQPAQDNQPTTTEARDWRESLPEPVREWQEVETAKSQDDLWKQMEHYRSAYGRSIRVPSEDAGAEDRAKFLERLRKEAPELVPAPNLEDEEAMRSLYASLGKPSDPANYKAPEIAAQFDQDQIARFKHIADKANLTQTQFQQVLGDFLQSEAEVRTVRQAELAEGRALLREELGLAHDRKINSAARVAEQFGFPEELIDAIKSGTVGAKSTRAFIRLAEATGAEGVNLAGAPPSQSTMLTPDDAREQMREIRNNKDHAYWKPSDPGHAAAKRRMRELSVMAQGGNNKEIDLQPATVGRG